MSRRTGTSKGGHPAKRVYPLSDMTFEGFEDMAKAIMAAGYDSETAYEYASLIGDTPLVDGGGNVVVKDGDQVLARLNLAKWMEE
jgi:hypothetical protein